MGRPEKRLASRLGLDFGAMAGDSDAGGSGVNEPRPFPPDYLLSDEKFAELNGERLYLFLVSEQELIWHTESMSNLDELTFAQKVENFLTVMEDAANATESLAAEAEYRPVSVTTDGCEAAQNGWKQKVPTISLIECHLHGRKRVSSTLDDFAQAHRELSQADCQKIKNDLDSIFTATSLSSFSQRIRRKLEQYHDEPILLKRLNILKQKRFLFTNHLKFENASACSAPLDRSMRFLDEKLQTFGQFRADHAINPMLNAWAIVNDLRSFLPDARKAGQSLAESLGAKLKGLPWMEALNLCTVGNLDLLLPDPEG